MKSQRRVVSPLMAELYNSDEESECTTSIDEMDSDDEVTESESEEEEETDEEDEEDEEDEDEDEEDEEDEEEEEEEDASDSDMEEEEFTDDDEEEDSETETETEEEEEEEEYIPVVNSPRVSEGEIGEENAEYFQANRTEIDGEFCPICMEAWTNGGTHHICCLPCGHLYGLSCITKWLRQNGSPAKCPQCNRECSLQDVTKLFAPRISAIDNEAQEKIRALEVKCAFLEAKVWLHVEGIFEQLKLEANLK